MVEDRSSPDQPMEIPDDIYAMLDGVHMKSSARNLTQLTQLLSDGVVVAHLIHMKFPRLISIHNYTITTNTAQKHTNWVTLNTKVLTKLKCPLPPATITRITTRDNATQLIVDTLRDLQYKIRAYEPVYAATSTPSLADQKKKDLQRMGASGAGNNKAAVDPSLTVAASLKIGPAADTRRASRLLNLGDLETATADGSLNGGATGSSSVGALTRSSSGISPPQRMKPRQKGDSSRRPSRIAAGIAGCLMHLQEGESLKLGTLGRAAGQAQRSKQREDEALMLRKKGKTKRLSVQEMDEMFEHITTKMNDELTVHSDQLDRLDKKSREFDHHMKDLRTANQAAMNQTDKILAVSLRNDGKAVPTQEPGFAMGRPEFVKAPSISFGEEFEDGDRSSGLNHSFVGLVSPHSNQLEEIGDEEDLEFSPPPPPKGPPPPHVLAKAGLTPNLSLSVAAAGADSDCGSESEESEGSVVDGDAEAAAALYARRELSFNINTTEGEDVSPGKTPMGRPEPGTASARKVRLSISGPSGQGGGEGEGAGEEAGGNAPAALAPSPNGVDWCEMMSGEYGKHYYMHHTGISVWDKPEVGVVQCADPDSGKIYYVDMATGESSWTAPDVQ